MIKRRVKTVELGEANCHTFLATGITAYLLNGGHPKEIPMPYKTITLTPAQAQRLIQHLLLRLYRTQFFGHRLTLRRPA